MIRGSAGVASFLRPVQQVEFGQGWEDTMPDKRHQHYFGDDETIERNVERSREVIEARKHAHDGEDTPTPIDGDMPAPENARDEMRDMPVGGESNPNARGGTAKRHKSG
jgi:hypothetical protein